MSESEFAVSLSEQTKHLFEEMGHLAEGNAFMCSEEMNNLIEEDDDWHENILA